MKKKLEIIKFNNGELEIDVKVSSEEDTVWLSQKDMSLLFGVKHNTLSEHIKNIFIEEELEEKTSVEISDKSNGGRRPRLYNLDVIISVGYRVKSKQGVAFRKWATKLLKDYALKGYLVNTRKFNLPDLEEIVNVLDNARKTNGDLQLSSNDVLDFLLAYHKGLKILDDYDHQTIEKIKGSDSTYVIHYDECKRVIENAAFSNRGDLFGIEKDDSFKSAIATIYQSFDGMELYPTLEDKAANLLYLITKNHAYADGNKRIAATIFLYFLEKNKALYKQRGLRISNTTLATLTILVASSNPNDKGSIINLIKMLLSIE